jgi:hypothetical protein
MTRESIRKSEYGPKAWFTLQVSERARIGARCTRMSDSSDVEIFILAAVCQKIEKKIKL